MSFVPDQAKEKKDQLKARLKKEKDKFLNLTKQKPKMPTCKGFFPTMPKIDWVTIGAGGTFVTCLILWYSIRYYELFLPFVSGGLRLFKYFLICTAILYFMATFVQTSHYFYWWYESTLYFFRRMVDPLLNQKVKYWYYYFTDYINWIVYYPAKTYYFFRFVANVFFFLLIILPVMAFIAFFIGLLFSWLGEAKEEKSILDPMVQELKTAATSAKEQASSMVSNKMAGLASLMSFAKGLETKGLETKGLETKGLETKGIESKGIESKVLGSQLDPSKLDLSKLDLSKLGVSKMDPSKVDVSKLDPSKLGLSQLDPSKILKTLRS